MHVCVHAHTHLYRFVYSAALCYTWFSYLLLSICPHLPTPPRKHGLISISKRILLYKSSCFACLPVQACVFCKSTALPMASSCLSFPCAYAFACASRPTPAWWTRVASFYTGFRCVSLLICALCLRPLGSIGSGVCRRAFHYTEAVVSLACRFRLMFFSSHGSSHGRFASFMPMHIYICMCFFSPLHGGSKWRYATPAVGAYC